MKIALAQFNPTVGDFEGNRARIVDMARMAKAGGADMAVFSELCLCGYPPQDLIERPSFAERNQKELGCLAEQVVLPSVVGFVGKAQDNTGKPVANSAALIAGGKILFEQRKMLLPTYDVFDESRYFQPAHTQYVFAMGADALGITICEDCWNDKNFWVKRLYDRDPVAELAGKGSTLLLNISSSPYTFDKRAFRLEMLRATARQHGLPFVYVNQVGGNDSLVFDGSSVVIAPDGRVIAQGKSFEEDLIYFDSQDLTGEIHEQVEGEEASAYHALVLGTRDYVHKCGFKSAIIGLSGGIDSALTACIAAEALGSENIIGIGMPGPYSSRGSVEDARQLAKNLNIRFELLSINEIYGATRRTLSTVFAGLPEDTTEENIQSRARGMVLMAMSNKFGALVLSTGNKSELAVGYCTLYGDMVGGLAVISDVPKALVYRLSGYINSRREVIPQATIEKPPSAELRAGQKDSDSLPPYDVLDAIIEDFVEDSRSAEQIAEAHNFDINLVRQVVRMVERSEYKRQQAAPGIKISAKAFGYGRRFPIAAKGE